MGISNGWDLRLWVVKVLYEIGHGVRERGGDERKKKSRGEREASRFLGGGRDRKEGKEEGVSEITKMPLLY